MSNISRKTHETVVLAMLCALSFIAVLLGRLIPNVAGFLSYDPKDAVIAITGFIFGPMSSVAVTVAVALIEFFSISGTGIYGLIMNILSTCAFACPAALIYQRYRRMGGAILGLTAGMFSITLVMVLWNYIITPFYMGVSRAEVAAMIPTVFLPFNLLKGGINAGLTMVLYKPVVNTLRLAHLLPQSEESKRGRFNLGFTLFALWVLITFVLLFMVFFGLI